MAGTLGEPFSLYFRMRMGDGWGEDAYLARQPFFRDYPRLLVFETGVHFLDPFRFLFGEIEMVYARLRRLNPVIQGEDSGQILLGCHDGVSVTLDASRYNEAETEDAGIRSASYGWDGSKGHLTMDTAGDLTFKLLGQPPVSHAYSHEHRGFAGDCCYAVERHFVNCLLSDQPFESEGDDYLPTLQAVGACYVSHERGEVIHLLG